MLVMTIAIKLTEPMATAFSKLLAITSNGNIPRTGNMSSGLDSGFSRFITKLSGLFRTYLKIKRVCDGGHFRACREARSDIGSLPMSDK
jgi:hypothetical protein